MTDNLQSELVYSYLSTTGLEWLKRQPWFPWVTTDAKNWNKAASAFIAFLGSVGIIFTATHSGVGVWDIHITGMTLGNILHVVGHAVRIYALQKTYFKAVIQASPVQDIVKAVVAEIQQNQTPVPATK